MKQRKIRRELEWILTFITAILFVGVIMIEDIQLQAIPYVLLALGVILVNIYVLSRWGRGLLLKHGE